MLSSFPSQAELVQIAETALIATVGGVGFYLIGFPGGLVSGSMLTVAIAALAGRPMKIPVPMARVCFVLVGILLGAVVTPDTLKGIAAWPLSVALLVIAAICMMTATAFYLRVVHGWDPLSALLGASPGSMAQVMALSAEFKADVRGIAIVHVMRVLLIVLGLPAGLALFGSTVEPVVSTRGVSETSLVELVALVTISTLAAIVMLRVRFPGGLLFGAMAGSGLLHGTDLVHVSLPWWAGGAAVLTLGAVAGARFANTSPRMLLSYLGAAFGSFAVAVAVAASFALIVVALLPFRIADVIVAFAPGAQDTMMVLALALHLDPVYVGAHHLARFLAVSFSVAVVARRLVRKLPPPPPQSWKRPGQGTFDD
ncbi:MAG TPA: AbrB family transcriptional regulator [Xanthobacteraceae bacterium]|nr:AbrB family transcriptional regulator [Xanthobacteraceae bacterium]